MLDHFPKQFSKRSIILYFLLLATVSFIYSQYALKFQWIVFGTVEVCMFFIVAANQPGKWRNLSDKAFLKKLFWTAVSLRLAYVIFSYFYYKNATGIPFEFGAADSLNYDSRAKWVNLMWNTNNLKEYWKFVTEELPDCGYATYLAILYRLTGNSIIIARFVKAFIGAYTCVLIYRLAARHFGERTGRMAGIFCMIMPNLIFYCGLHLKEVEMTFLIALFVERADFALSGEKMKVKPLIWAIVAALALFTFRTAVGAVALMSLAAAALLSSSKKVPWWKKIAVVLVIVVGIFVSSGSVIVEETKALWEEKDTNQKLSMEYRSGRIGGNEFAKYAGAAVFAPMIFTIPFPTLVETEGQENMRIINGGNFVKNITSVFTIFALIMLLISGDWRKHVLPLALMVGYLAVIAFSAFAQSERFHYPVLPFELMFAACGISMLKNKHKWIFTVWMVVIFAANIAWAWFKLAGRGLV